MKCRTEVIVPNLKPILERLRDINSRLKYFFVLVENERVIIERVSLIDGSAEDIRKEKVFILEHLKELSTNESN